MALIHTFQTAAFGFVEVAHKTASSSKGHLSFNNLLLASLRLAGACSPLLKEEASLLVSSLTHYKILCQGIGCVSVFRSTLEQPLSLLGAWRFCVSLTLGYRFLEYTEIFSFETLGKVSSEMGSSGPTHWSLVKSFLSLHMRVLLIGTSSIISIVEFTLVYYRAKTPEEYAKAVSSEQMLFLASHVAKIGVLILGSSGFVLAAASVDVIARLASYSRFVIANKNA